MFRFKDFVEENRIKQKDLCELFNVSQPYISSLINGKQMINDDKVELLKEKYGEIVDKYISDDSLIYDNAHDSFIKFVPLIPLSAQGGQLNDFVMSVRYTDCEKIVSPIRDCDIAIPVAGDSMAPEYPNGCKVLAKRIDEKSFIEWGKTYVLDTCNGAIIKVLVPSQRDGYVKCLSINPSPIYAPFEVALSDINAIFRVQLCMALK